MESTHCLPTRRGAGKFTRRAGFRLSVDRQNHQIRVMQKQPRAPGSRPHSATQPAITASGPKNCCKVPPAFTSSPIDLGYDLEQERAIWPRMAAPDLFAAGNKLERPGRTGSDPRVVRGRPSGNLGLYEEARNEFEALRKAVADPVQTYRLMNYLLDLGLTARHCWPAADPRPGQTWMMLARSKRRFTSTTSALASTSKIW
jgi:hypothetical protein